MGYFRVKAYKIWLQDKNIPFEIYYEKEGSFLFSIEVFDIPAQCNKFAAYDGSEMLIDRNFDMIFDLEK